VPALGRHGARLLRLLRTDKPDGLADIGTQSPDRTGRLNAETAPYRGFESAPGRNRTFNLRIKSLGERLVFGSVEPFSGVRVGLNEGQFCWVRDTVRDTMDPVWPCPPNLNGREDSSTGRERPTTLVWPIRCAVAQLVWLRVVSNMQLS
jgi:hypothetical protein